MINPCHKLGNLHNYNSLQEEEHEKKRQKLIQTAGPNMLSSEAIATGLRRYEILVTILLLTAKSAIANHPSSHGHHHGMRPNENNTFCFQIDFCVILIFVFFVG